MYHTKINTLVDLALEEDAALGDVTSESIFPAGHVSRANILAREDMVICGLEVAKRVFQRVDPALNVQLETSDGEQVNKGSTVLLVEGPTISLLIAERTALNFLQRLSGIASLSRRFSDAANKTATGVRIVDTRKTTPGWRALEKYAVRCGGCFNHRSSLGEHVLIKENHITAAGSLKKAVKLTREFAPHCAKIEVETESLAQVNEALEAGA
jgi:nicotinate-nucleotide pyrophosphorylase (carboxylating)